MRLADENKYLIQAWKNTFDIHVLGKIVSVHNATFLQKYSSIQPSILPGYNIMTVSSSTLPQILSVVFEPGQPSCKVE